MLGMLYPMEKAELCEKRFERKRKIKLISSGLLLGAVLVISAARSREESVIYGENRIVRPERGSSEILLCVGNGVYSMRLLLDVDARVKTGRELDELFDKAFAMLEKEMCGKNTSLLAVEYPLVLPASLPELETKVTWEASDSRILRADGELCNFELEGPEQLLLQATVTYGDESRTKSYSVVVLPYPYSGQELFEQEVRRAVEESGARTSRLDYLELPQTISDGELQWEEEGRGSSRKIYLLLWVGAMVLICLRETSELRNRMKKREGQLLADYPDFLSRFLLLLGAGMNVRGAWERMTEDYKRGGRSRYVYEEMRRTTAQLEVGMPELQAYEIFGRRCGLLPYLRFAAILSQNLKKGSRGIAELLQTEAHEVFSERMAQARRKGEEAGTRLLLPMGGMLILVLIIILIPAFSSFSL